MWKTNTKLKLKQKYKIELCASFTADQIAACPGPTGGECYEIVEPCDASSGVALCSTTETAKALGESCDDGISETGPDECDGAGTCGGPGKSSMERIKHLTMQKP